MATNVTEKDKTLNDVIEWCGEQVSGIEKKDSHGVGRGFPQRRTMRTAGRRGVLRNRRLYGHTVRQLEQAQAEGPATPDVSPGDAYRRTHAKGRRLDGKNQRNV